MSEEETQLVATVEEVKVDENVKNFPICLELCRRKRVSKRNTTKFRHRLEKLFSAPKTTLDKDEIEHSVEGLWSSLEATQDIMDELSAYYLKQKDDENQKAVMKESNELEVECQQAIERAQAVLISGCFQNVKDDDNVEGGEGETTGSNVNDVPDVTEEQVPPITTGNTEQQPVQEATDAGGTGGTLIQPTDVPVESSSNHTQMSSAIGNSSINRHLKPLKVPDYDGNKAKFEQFWSLFESLVDKSNEPVSLKMARLRQSLSGRALEAIRGLGVSEHEYNEAKEILQSKFGGRRRQLRGYMDELESMPTIRNNDVDAFEKFADLVRVTVVKLEAEGRSGELGDGALHSLLVKKLSERQVETYSRWLSEQQRQRTVLTLRDWLKEEVYIRVEATEMAQGVDPKHKEIDGARYRSFNRNYRARTTFSTREVNNRNGIGENTQTKPPCVVCEGNHGVWSCKKFIGKSVPERWIIAKEKRLCFRCLASDHLGKDCTRSKMCTVQGCRRSHHNLLHENAKKKEDEEEPPREGAANRVHMSRNKTELTAESLSLRTIPVWLKANGRKVKVNAILDDASNESFLNEQVAGALGLQEPYLTVKVHVLNNEVETFQSMPVNIVIESVDGQYAKEICVKTCPQKVTGTYKVEDWSQSKSNWPHLQRCDFATPAKDGLVDLLIGVDNADLLYSRADVRGEPGSPIARLGPLGWSCIGLTEKQHDSSRRTHTIRTLFSRNRADVNPVPPCCDVDEHVKRFWEIESCGTENVNTKVFTKEETDVLTKMKETMSYDSETSRYKIATPWKENRPPLPNNKEHALTRLSSTEKKLKKDIIVCKEYQQTIESYVEKGYLRKVTKDEAIPPEIWYLPHFPVIRMEKSTTKVRIVFDCSAKTDEISLNDIIDSGPKLQRELFDVLLRFRRHTVALACDIKEMYLQVEIEEKDRPFFRVLWRDLDSTKEPEVYEFTRVVFGKNSAPMEAQFIAQENARQHRESYPLAAETILKSTYMDDSIDSVQTEETGVELYHQLRALWSKAGMQARKWVSNSEKVMIEIPAADQAAQLTIAGNKDPVVNTLGLSWDSRGDVLTLPVPTVTTNLPMTKRNVLKKIAAVFDPLGLISPFIMVAKVILQELWSRGYDWDEIIIDEIANRIATWFNQLQKIATIKVPRCLCENKEEVSRELVTFVDASLKAYGAVVYLVCVYEDGSRSSRLITSKSKVAPLTPMTVPRLELMAAILGLRLTQNVLRALELNMQTVTFYSDSADVLWWIRGCGRDFRPFVANRIGEIQMYSNPTQWQHVRTDQNPADWCTRGATPVELAESTFWWNGPLWLIQETSQWPRMDLSNSPVNLPERKAHKNEKDRGKSRSMATTTSKGEAKPTDAWRLDPRRYSNWKHLIRIHARVKRVLINMRNEQKRPQNQRELTPDEIRDAEDAVIRQAQKEAFPAEYDALSKGKPISARSHIAKLSPRIDQQGVIRCDSRLYYAECLPFDARCPMILPRGHWVTKLIVRYYHSLANHVGGTNFVLAQLSQRFWIVAAREEIREWENECCTCQKRRNKLATQIMAPLPEVRLRFTYRAFDQAAVDYAGPFVTVQGRGKRRLKRWLCLFTCLTTRAVHLEVAWGLDTDSFLNAFTRFTSRRGVPKEIISDNGTNFVGAVNELKELVAQLDRDKVQQVTSYNGTKWSFNPPGGPHFGGVFEIMVKAAKKAIYAVLNNSDVTDEELITICAGVESLLNSRPITYQSTNPSDDVPLTPNHFLHGQLGGEFAPTDVDMDVDPRKRWRKVQAILSRVWSRWLKEYLPTLNTRSKWTEVVKDLQEGDVVMVFDKDLPRGKWPLGRIIETYPGKDGHTRVAKVQLGGKTLVRPIHKLVPLKV